MTTPAQPPRRRRGLSWRTIRAILRREFTDVRRDRRSLILTFLYPISMLIMYGYGIRYDVDNVPLTILDYDETPESRDLSEQMIRSGYFQLVRWARNQHEVDRDLTRDKSKADAMVRQSVEQMGFPNDEAARNSPALLMGTVDEVKRELRARIDDFGLTFFTAAIFGQDAYEMFVDEVMPAFAS